MSYNGTGTFNINTAGQPVVSGTTITSTAFNLLTADLATGLTTALTKDGQTTPTANIPMGTFKLTGLGAGTAATDAAQYGQLQAGATTIAIVTGTDTLVGTLTPAPTAYAAGNLFSFVAANTNTGAATININSLGAKSITKQGLTALAAGDIVSGQISLIEYDGTRFQLINPSGVTGVSSISFGSTGLTPATATSGAVSVAGTLAVANGGTGLTSGTSGGVLYYSATGTLASSAALTASTLLVGGGAGVAPTTTTTATGALTFLGTPSSANLASMMTDETGSGLLVFGTTPALTNPTITNYVETPYTATIAAGAITLSLTNGTVQFITFGAASATITMPTAVSGKSFTLFLKQDSVGSRAATWTTVSWPSATAPTLTSVANKLDKFVFTSDGTSWFGSTAGQNYT